MAFRRLNDDDDSNRANDYLFLCVRDSIPLPTYYRFFKRHFSNYFRDEEDNNGNNNNYKFVVQL